MKKTTTDGSVLEGTPLELVEYEGGQSIVVPRHEIKETMQATEPEPEPTFEIEERTPEKNIVLGLYKSHSKKRVDMMVKAVKFYYAHNGTIFNAMNEAGLACIGSDYRFFKEVCSALYGGKSASARQGVNPNYTKAVEYFKDNKASIWHTLKMFNLQLGNKGYADFKDAVKKAYPREAEQLLGSRFNSLSISPRPMKSRKGIPEEYVEACSYFMIHRASINYVMDKFHLLKSTSGYKNGLLS